MKGCHFKEVAVFKVALKRLHWRTSHMVADVCSCRRTVCWRQLCQEISYWIWDMILILECF